jgi:hypothetical protein
MNHLLHVIAALALTTSVAQADEPKMPKFEYAGPVELPDSDTSSLGQETLPKDTPFMLRCTDAKTFTATAKRLKAKGMIVGEDMFDKTLIMVFKYEDGSINFVRSDKQGKTLCMFGAITEPDINLGVVMGGNKEYDN